MLNLPAYVPFVMDALLNLLSLTCIAYTFLDLLRRYQARRKPR